MGLLMVLLLAFYVINTLCLLLMDNVPLSDDNVWIFTAVFFVLIGSLTGTAVITLNLLGFLLSKF